MVTAAPKRMSAGMLLLAAVTLAVGLNLFWAPAVVPPAQYYNSRAASPIFHEAEKKTNHQDNSKNNNNNVEQKFATLWPSLQEELCPNMVPRIDIGPLLFDIARSYFPTISNDNNNKLNASVPLRKHLKNHEFYSGFYGYHRNTAYKLTFRDKNVSMIYIRILKCGNDNIGKWFRDIRNRIKGAVLTKLDNPPPLDDDHNMCLFTAIRDPISHFLSGYNEHMFRLIKDQDRNGVFARANATIQANRNLTIFVRKFLEHDDVTWDVGAALHFFPMMRILAALATHYYNQNHTVRPSDLAYLPTLADMPNRLPTFVDQACAKQLGDDLWGNTNTTRLAIQAPMEDQNTKTVEVTPQPKEEANSSGTNTTTVVVKHHHPSTDDPYGTYTGAKAVWKEQGPTAKALCALHLLDYACWRDLVDGVPPLCRQVFMQDEFLERLKGHSKVGVTF